MKFDIIFTCMFAFCFFFFISCTVSAPAPSALLAVVKNRRSKTRSQVNNQVSGLLTDERFISRETFVEICVLSFCERRASVVETHQQPK